MHPRDYFKTMESGGEWGWVFSGKQIFRLLGLFRTNGENGLFEGLRCYLWNWRNERKKEKKKEYLNRKWWKKRWFCGMFHYQDNLVFQEDQQNNFHCWKEHLEIEEIENSNVLCKEMEVVSLNELNPREIWFNFGRYSSEIIKFDNHTW